MDLIENAGFGASPIRTSVASIPVVFFVVVSLLMGHIMFADFSMIFLKNGYYLSLNRGTTHKTGIMDPIEFWWVP